SYLKPPAAKIFVDLCADRFAYLFVLCRQVERRYFQFAERVRKFRNDHAFQLSVDVLGLELAVRSGDLLDKAGRIGNTQAVSTKSTQPDDAEIIIAEHYRVRGPPF